MLPYSMLCKQLERCKLNFFYSHQSRKKHFDTHRYILHCVLPWSLSVSVISSMLLLFKTVWMFAQGIKMIEFCCFRVGEWVFIFLNECPMTVISYHTAPSHIDHLEWSGWYHLGLVINYGEIQHLLQINRTKKKSARITCMGVSCQNTILSIDYNDRHILPLDKVQQRQKHTPKQRTEIQLYTFTPHIVNVIMNVWSWSWELLACMINNRFVRSLESSRVVCVGCLASPPWGLEAAMVYVVSRSDISGSS